MAYLLAFQYMYVCNHCHCITIEALYCDDTKGQNPRLSAIETTNILYCDHFFSLPLPYSVEWTWPIIRRQSHPLFSSLLRGWPYSGPDATSLARNGATLHDRCGQEHRRGRSLQGSAQGAIWLVDCEANHWPSQSGTLLHNTRGEIHNNVSIIYAFLCKATLENSLWKFSESVEMGHLKI